MTPVQISSAASHDVRSAAKYYAEEGAGLARAFLDDFDRTCSLVAQAPEIGTPIGSGFRKLVMQRYPFIVIYRFEHGRAMVFAVGHQRRHPDFWLHRI